MEPDISVMNYSEMTNITARVLYEAYVANNGGKAWNGAIFAAWDGLDDHVKDRWCSIAVLAQALALDMGVS